MHPSSNSNESRQEYNCTVNAHAPNTAADGQCMTKLKMAWPGTTMQDFTSHSQGPVAQRVVNS